ncbi:MAG: hypothetical protein PVJ76_09850 [Gemmatimonadota bacterium]|jgi:hypothetical protein
MRLFPRQWLSLLILSLPLLLPGTLQAQQEVTAEIRGEVRVGEAPVTEGTVVLHRVSETESGEIDSVRVAPDGSFVLRLPHVPDHAARQEIFFASVEYGGLLYFGPAVTEAIHLDSLYLIQAFDTVSAPPGGAQLPLSFRNLFLEKTEPGWMATDVFQLRNEGDRTLYSPEEGPVWSYPLPSSAGGLQVGQADMAPDAVRLENGRMNVYSPLPPGERYLMVRYAISIDDFVLPLPGQTDRMEVLVREPGPSVEIHPLRPAPPIEIEPGNSFRRYAADSLTDAEIRAQVEREPWALPPEWIGILVASLLAAAGVLGYRLRRRTSPLGFRRESPPSDRYEVLMEIAELDERFQASGETSDQARAEYQAARNRLLTRLRSLS